MRQGGQRSRLGWVLVFLWFLIFVPPLPAQEEAELARINRLIEQTKKQLSRPQKNRSLRS